MSNTDDLPALPEPTFAEVVAFLDGAGPLRGVYFGQKPHGECAAFWWREHLRAAVAQRDEQIARLQAELEIERMRVVACGVIAMANTEKSAKKVRQIHPDYWCASVQDVATAVDREMALRAEVEARRADAERCAMLRAMAQQVVDADDKQELTQQMVELLRTAIDAARVEAKDREA